MADSTLSGGGPHVDQQADGSFYPMVEEIPRPAQTILNLASTTYTSSGNSGSLSVATVHHLAVDVNVTAVAGVTPSLTLRIDRQGADGGWYPIWTSSAINAASTVSASIGAGLTTNVAIGDTVRLVWVISGASASFTFTASIKGK